MKKLLLGDEAIAQGALDAGLSGVYAYPGTPSTEITEYIQDSPLAKERGVHSRWSTNEKTAMEAALGMSYMGKRALVCMKHVGLNVCADPFVNSAMTGTNGGITLTPTAGKLSNLVLSTTGSEPLFRAATNGENVAANNAWLQLPTSIYNGQQVTITFESNSSGGLNGDLNKDGNITVTDVMILVNMALGLL